MKLLVETASYRIIKTTLGSGSIGHIIVEQRKTAALGEVSWQRVEPEDAQNLLCTLEELGPLLEAATKKSA